MDGIKFSNQMMKDRVRDNFYQRYFYKIVQLKKTGELYIFNGISDHMTLVQLIDTAGNANHVVSITRFWIYDFNYKRALTLIK